MISGQPSRCGGRLEDQHPRRAAAGPARGSSVNRRRPRRPGRRRGRRAPAASLSALEHRRRRAAAATPRCRRPPRPRGPRHVEPAEHAGGVRAHRLAARPPSGGSEHRYSSARWPEPSRNDAHQRDARRPRCRPRSRSSRRRRRPRRPRPRARARACAWRRGRPAAPPPRRRGSSTSTPPRSLTTSTNSSRLAAPRIAAVATVRTGCGAGLRRPGRDGRRRRRPPRRSWRAGSRRPASGPCRSA